jgi:hypothetical protein
MSQPHGDPLDKLVVAVARRQHRNITRKQLLGFGLTDDAIARRVRQGWLHRVHQGVYAVGTPPLTPIERASAAVLACGRLAVLSHHAAAALWGFVKYWPQIFDVTAPVDRRPPGIRTHRSTALTRADRRHHMGIWVTSPARTVLDFAPELSEQKLVRLLNDARLSHFLKPNALIETLLRFPRHPGAPDLWPLLMGADEGPTRSGFEDMFPTFCESFGLPQPLINAPVAGYEADAYFKQEGVVVELDSYEFHSDRATWESDRERDAHRLDSGLLTVRLTWDRVIYTPVKEARRLGRILERRRNGG